MTRVINRHNLKDQYYTSEHIVQQCVQQIKQKISTEALWLLDSSCGNNYFAHLMDLPHISVDIEPVNLYETIKTIELIRADFLTLDINLPDKEFIMGFNPPFGLRNTLAKKFIQKLYSFKPKYLALVLLNNKGWRFPGYKILLQNTLPKNSFVFDDKPKDVPCTFFLLERGVLNDKPTTLIQRTKHYKLQTTKCIVKRGKTDLPSKYCIAVRYVGAYAGSQYYIFYEGYIYFMDYMKHITMVLEQPKHKISNVFTLIHFNAKTELPELFRLVSKIYEQSSNYIDKTAIRANFNTNDVKKIVDIVYNYC